MATKLRDMLTVTKVKAFRSAVVLGSLLVLLESLGAPRKLS
jgi:hypothetical protein